MKEIQIMTGRTRNRLTVTPSRITMKFESMVHPEDLAYLIKVKEFFEKIAKDLEDTKQALRGHLTRSGSITMRYNDKTVYRTYFLDQSFEPKSLFI